MCLCQVHQCLTQAALSRQYQAGSVLRCFLLVPIQLQASVAVAVPQPELNFSVNHSCSWSCSRCALHLQQVATVLDCSCCFSHSCSCPLGWHAPQLGKPVALTSAQIQFHLHCIYCQLELMLPLQLLLGSFLESFHGNPREAFGMSPAQNSEELSDKTGEPSGTAFRQTIVNLETMSEKRSGQCSDKLQEDLSGELLEKLFGPILGQCWEHLRGIFQ